MNPDFSLLYSELKLPPDCSLEEFKCAYGRRIAELHPDRTGADPSSPAARTLLPALISMYVAVNRFHRRHGRMPGAPPRSATGNAPPPSQAISHSGHPMATSHRPGRATRSIWGFVMLFLALLALLLALDWWMFRAQ